MTQRTPSWKMLRVLTGNPGSAAPIRRVRTDAGVTADATFVHEDADHVDVVQVAAGDVAVVDREDVARGDVVAVTLDDGVTLRRRDRR